MIAIVDYGVGNLFSLCASLDHIGAKSTISSDARALLSADKLILPGVGAFGDAADKLRASGLYEPILEFAASNKPLLGICLGMQLLFDTSYEYGVHKGLGLIHGEIRPFEGNIPEGLKIPHMGWNALCIRDAGDPILKYTNDGDSVYFVHSYYAALCDEAVTSSAEYGVDVPASVRSGNVFGTQFHPEKSGAVGLLMLKAFVEL